MAVGYQMKDNIVSYLLMKYVSLLTSRFSPICVWLNSCHMGICWHGRSRIHPDIDVSKYAICTICRGWMAAGYQMKGNIVFYLLMKYVSLLTSRFSPICLSLNSCHMGICWHDCSRIQPDIDVSKNAICTICRGWMAAGYQMIYNIVFYLLMKYFSLLTSRFRQYVINWSLVIWRLRWHGRARMHPDIDVSKYAICTICRGWMAAGHQMKSNIVFYLLMIYLSLLTSRFPQYVFNWSLVIWRLRWHGRARMHPDIDVSKYAICTICRGWMAAGYQMKGNIVFYLLMKYLSLLTCRYSTICL